MYASMVVYRLIGRPRDDYGAKIAQLRGQLASPLPTTSYVLPVSLVQGTRGYLEKVIQQANGCFEHQWFDGCAVMMRRFVETMIIEVYEKKGRDSEIKGVDGNFLSLDKLVDRIANDQGWNLSRDYEEGIGRS